MLFLLLPLLAFSADWTQPLAARLKTIDRETSGALGVYVKRAGAPEFVSHGADRPWYLSSTTKVPIAVLLLKKVEAGEISLSEELVLRESDYVDGAGVLQRTKPGTKFSVGELLRRMLVHSDSSATDMLIRRIGLQSLNDYLGEGFNDFTTILQVRYDAFGELHPRAKELANTDFIEFKRAGGSRERLALFLARLGLKPADLRMPTIEAAFEKYYGRGLNSGSLTAYGALLEKLVAGEILNRAHTELLLGHMKKITTGERRIKAGLPKGTEFAQKTGTQVGRICNMGVIQPAGAAVVVTACVEKFDGTPEAEGALRRVGEAIAASGVL